MTKILLSLLHILLCVSLHGVAEASFSHLGVAKWTKRIGVGPSPPCGAPPSRGRGEPRHKRQTEKPCRRVPPRPPRLP
ncbi:hypothetical protein F2Q70_00026954 [Brassica cretica]|uniref:Uncharacterized protein n=2 Tax=Brassica TaxID=3705 RepID=A0A3N6RBL9_BRACR|nr:hypothetical protein F2Q70_00026954 [Brassica cretica]KAF3582114.1 hypothetical protein DY000_02032858 [Brassica cretica]KAG2287089.1 hypothetical protein Bca52824_046693 [Brassica carinata]